MQCRDIALTRASGNSSPLRVTWNGEPLTDIMTAQRVRHDANDMRQTRHGGKLTRKFPEGLKFVNFFKCF
jgi:hypothetical protein